MDFSKREFKISIHGLKAGMYVSRLDRPWINSPFPLEGLLLSSDEEVEEIRQLCRSVYVDSTRGVSPDLRYVQFDSSSPGKPTQASRELAALHTTHWQIQKDFQSELPQARQAHDTLKHGIEEVMRDIKQGHNLQLEKLREGVDAMISSITRNPTAFSWLREIKRKDNYAYHHALSCSVWSACFGRHLGLNRAELTELTLAGLLFDVGKTRVDSQMLTKSAVYDDHDHLTMRGHVEYSVDILKQTPGVSARIVQAVATHHERHDGSGYPQKLHNGSIPIFGRIIGLIDSYDAMTSIRPHMGSRSPHQVVMELYESRDRLFQAELVEMFIQISGIYPLGSLVELSNGQVGVITQVHSLKRLRPTVMLLLDQDKQPLAEFSSVDLGMQQPVAGEAVLSIKSGLAQGAYGLDPAELFLD